jgi:membrane protease YdiL (CAAX protease family)
MVDLQRPQARSAAAVPSRWLLVAEVLLVLGLSLGRSGINDVVSFVANHLSPPGGGPPSDPVLYESQAPGRPWVDLVKQLLELAFTLVPVALAAYLLVRSGDRVRERWLGGRFRLSDLWLGALVAGVVGAVGRPFYLLTHDTTGAAVVPDTLPHEWWRLPVLVLRALGNGLVEECVLLGFVLVRLRQLGLRAPTAIGLAALLRGSYHLYQGIGGFLGNVGMGLFFGWLYHRWGRVTPLVLAHTLIDVGAFVGYALLAGRVAWVPT